MQVHLQGGSFRRSQYLHQHKAEQTLSPKVHQISFPSHDWVFLSGLSAAEENNKSLALLQPDGNSISSHLADCVVSCACVCTCVPVSVSLLLLLLPYFCLPPALSYREMVLKRILEAAGTMGPSLCPEAGSTRSSGGPQLHIHYFQVVSVEILGWDRYQTLQLHDLLCLEEQREFREGKMGCSEEETRCRFIILSVLSVCHWNTLTPSFIMALSLEISIIAECHTDKMFN